MGLIVNECIICADDSSFKDISLIVPGHQYVCFKCWPRLVTAEKCYKCPICQKQFVNNQNGPSIWRLVDLNCMKRDMNTALEVYRSHIVAKIREILIKNIDKIVFNTEHLTNKTVEHKIADLAYTVYELKKNKPIKFLNSTFEEGLKLIYTVSNGIAILAVTEN